METKYKVIEGTSYNEQTPADVVRVLERARLSRQRVRIHYGDVGTGRDWMDRYGVEGYVSRSMGPVKIPILRYNSRSIGGGAILDRCIVKIATARGKRVLYQHPTYNQDPSPVKV